MSIRMIYSSIGVWFAMIAALMSLALVSGVPVSIGGIAVALLVAFMPPALMLRLAVNARSQQQTVTVERRGQKIFKTAKA